MAAVVCPPEARSARLLGPLLREFTLHMGTLPAHLRLGVFAALVLFDQRARLYPPARGRRFVDLDLTRADAYFTYLAHQASARERNLAESAGRCSG